MTLDPAVNQETGACGRRYQGITLTCGRVEFSAIATPRRSRWMSNNYITGCHRRLELVRVSCSWSSSCSSRQWEPAPDRGLAALSDPRLSSPAEWERSAAIVRGTWGQYVAVCSVSNSPLTPNPFATLSIIKCDGKIIKTPRREFISRTCEDGAAWHLIPRRISSSKDSLFGCRETGRLCWG